MNKLIRLSPTGIEYGDYAWNFASGCGNNVDSKCRGGGFKCWAYPITQRFADRYPNGFKPTIHLDALLSPLYLKKPSRILCAFMGDLFWDCPEFDPGRCGPFGEDEHGLFTLKGRIYDTVLRCPQHTFLFLTKQPQNLPAWSPFPDNCSVGVSWIGDDESRPLRQLARVEAKLKFISFEPLLHFPDWWTADLLRQAFHKAGVKWVVIGAQSKPTVYPKIEWVQEIVEACDRAGIPVFLKDNLKPLLRQNDHNIYSYPEWAGKQFAVTGDRSLAPTKPHPNEPMRTLRQEMPSG